MLNDGGDDDDEEHCALLEEKERKTSCADGEQPAGFSFPTLSMTGNVRRASASAFGRCRSSLLQISPANSPPPHRIPRTHSISLRMFLVHQRHYRAIHSLVYTVIVAKPAYTRQSRVELKTNRQQH